jgi:hypothetical protein
VSVTYTNKQNETHRTVFNVGVNYGNAVKKDVESLKTLDVETLGSDLPTELLEQARIALLKSKQKPNKNISQGIQDAFETIIPGVRRHKETGQVFVHGMKVQKTVLEEGEYTERKKKPLTQAKDAIRNTLKANQFRRYELSNASNFTLKGDTIIFD